MGLGTWSYVPPVDIGPCTGSYIHGRTTEAGAMRPNDQERVVASSTERGSVETAPIRARNRLLESTGDYLSWSAPRPRRPRPDPAPLPLGHARRVHLHDLPARPAL